MDAHVGKYVTCMACDVATSAPAAASALIIVKQQQQQQQDEENTQAEKQSRAEQTRPEQTELSRNVVAILAVRWPATTMIVEWKST